MKIEPVSSVRLEREKIIAFLTDSKKSKLNPALENMVERLIKDVESFFEPHLEYLVNGVRSISKGQVYLEEGVVFSSFKLARAFKDCQEMMVFIGTIGRKLEIEVESLLRKNLLTEAFILDAIGSVAVESLVRDFHRRLAVGCEGENKEVTFRFSPGYCDWDITEQKKLFSLFKDRTIKVELTSSFLMIPRKSVSGVIGIAKRLEGEDVANYNPCSDCSRANCPNRRWEKFD